MSTEQLGIAATSAVTIRSMLAEAERSYPRFKIKLKLLYPIPL